MQLIQNSVLLDITFVTERDASLVDFIDPTTGKVLSRHKAGFAVHVTVTNKKIQDMLIQFQDLKINNVDIAVICQPALVSVQVGFESRGQPQMVTLCNHSSRKLYSRWSGFM